MRLADGAVFELSSFCAGMPGFRDCTAAEATPFTGDPTGSTEPWPTCPADASADAD